MEFGLSKSDKNILTTIFDKHLTAGKIILYGSRAKGTFSDRSDIDLIIKQGKTTDRQVLANIKDEIEESDCPYLVDIQFFETIENSRLIEHIERVGKIFHLIEL